MWLRLLLGSFIILVLGTTRAKADAFYQLVSYTCDQYSDRIVIDYRSAFNEAGADMVANKGPDSWEPTRLLSMRDKNHIDHLIWVRKRCQLSDGKYDVAISAAPENFNIQGFCGGDLSAQVKVQLGNTVLFAGEFDRSCSHPGDPAYRRFIVHAKSHEVTLVP